jgi:hypothetical protein
MFRFSNGLRMHSGFGIDEKGYFIFEGLDLSIRTGVDSWHLEDKNSDTRIWWRDTPGKLLTFEKPLSDHFFIELIKKLEQIEHSSIHPSLINGLFGEAERLFPEINDRSKELFKGFVNYLNFEFDLFSFIKSPKNYSAFCEDIGPCMIGTINNQLILSPEIPKLYSAPTIWAKLTWLINNHFSGPYPLDPLRFNGLNGRKFDWGHLKIEPEFKNEQIEGLVYFFIAKFIIIHEAWADNKSPESLRMLVELIQLKKERPWKYLY